MPELTTAESASAADLTRNSEPLSVKRALDSPVTLGVVVALLSGVIALLGATYRELAATRDKLHALHVEHSTLAGQFGAIRDDIAEAKRLLAATPALEQARASAQVATAPERARSEEADVKPTGTTKGKTRERRQ